MGMVMVRLGKKRLKLNYELLRRVLMRELGEGGGGGGVICMGDTEECREESSLYPYP